MQFFYLVKYPQFCNWKKGCQYRMAEIIPDEPDTVSTVGGIFYQRTITAFPILQGLLFRLIEKKEIICLPFNL